MDRPHGDGRIDGAVNPPNGAIRTLTSTVFCNLFHPPAETVSTSSRHRRKNSSSLSSTLLHPPSSYVLFVFALLLHFDAIMLNKMTSVTPIPVKNCDGGHYCSPPKECCKQGCCYLLAPSVAYRPPTLPTTNMLTPLFMGHWYFWAAVTATLAGILCACSVWRKHSQRSLCCRSSGRDDRASEPDSNGSYYAPPHYSRCNSFHQAPPPYSEVTSKPDLYPLVISYNGVNVESNPKIGRASAGYLMCQYFRNYIVRPSSTLSATSTMDSLGSSFICNASNEANILVPPPYSCTGSLEEVSVGGEENRNNHEFPRSISSATCNDFNVAQHTPSPPSQRVSTAIPSPNGASTNPSNALINASGSREVSITSNPCFVDNASNGSPSIHAPMSQNNCDVKRVGRLHEYNSGESQEDDHNFSDLLNLSVCIPNTATTCSFGGATTQSQLHDLHQCSVVDSITSSDISSLANLGTPDSPPRATSPTAELRELLDKIQQLPQHNKSPVPHTDRVYENTEPRRGYFNRRKAKTLYMPLNDSSNSNCRPHQKHSPSGAKVFGRPSRSWLSKSAPTTPCGTFIPNFPTQKKTPCGSQRGSKGRICDGSPLLNENDESDTEDPGRNQCS